MNPIEFPILATFNQNSTEYVRCIRMDAFNLVMESRGILQCLNIYPHHFVQYSILPSFWTGNYTSTDGRFNALTVLSHPLEMLPTKIQSELNIISLTW